MYEVKERNFEPDRPSVRYMTCTDTYMYLGTCTGTCRSTNNTCRIPTYNVQCLLSCRASDSTTVKKSTKSFCKKIQFQVSRSLGGIPRSKSVLLLGSAYIDLHVHTEEHITGYKTLCR